MKLEMVRGCICDSLTIDGKEEIDLTDDERKKTIDYLMTNLEIPDDIIPEFLEWYISLVGDAEFEGSYNDDNWKDTYTIEI